MSAGIAGVSSALPQRLSRDFSRRTQRLWLLGALTLVPFSALLMAWSPHAVVFFVSNFLWWCGESIIYLVVTTTLQVESENAFRGRVMAFGLMVRIAGHNLGSVVAAQLMDGAHFSARHVILTFLLINALNLAVYALWYMRRWWPRDAGKAEETAAAAEKAAPAGAEAAGLARDSGAAEVE
jgi:predicted MFS family arabinose efflux permease